MPAPVNDVRKRIGRQCQPDHRPARWRRQNLSASWALWARTPEPGVLGQLGHGFKE
jgi:hypothetical protein